MQSAQQNYIGGTWVPATAAAPNVNPSNVNDVIADYARVFRLRQAAASRGRRSSTSRWGTRWGGEARASRIARRAITRGFAWMFSGARLPAPKLVDIALGLAEWDDNRRRRQGAA